jgi:hypothetical protein
MLNITGIQTILACNKYKTSYIIKWVANYMFTNIIEPVLESRMGGYIVYKKYRRASGVRNEDCLSSWKDNK